MHPNISLVSLSCFSLSTSTRISGALVVGGGGLAGLQLLEVPRASLHVALVLIQALSELLSVDVAVPGLPVVLLWSGLGVVDSGLWGSLGGAATEETTDGMADGGADCDTAVSLLVCGQRSSLPPRGMDWEGWRTYAAVEAMLAKRPGP